MIVRKWSMGQAITFCKVKKYCSGIWSHLNCFWATCHESIVMSAPLIRRYLESVETVTSHRKMDFHAWNQTSEFIRTFMKQSHLILWCIFLTDDKVPAMLISHFFKNTIKMPLGFWQQALKWNKTWGIMEKISDYLHEFKDWCNHGQLASLALFDLLSLLIVN